MKIIAVSQKRRDKSRLYEIRNYTWNSKLFFTFWILDHTRNGVNARQKRFIAHGTTAQAKAMLLQEIIRVDINKRRDKSRLYGICVRLLDSKKGQSLPHQKDCPSC